jgi:hypothetical protein
MDEDVHTPVSEGECDVDKKLYGDVKDPAVKDSMKYLENKNIEACPCAQGKEEKEKGFLPGMPDLSGLGFKDGPAGPAVETSIMEGYKKLEPKNASDGKHESGMTSKEFAAKHGPKNGKSADTVTPQGGKDIKQMGKETGDMLIKCDGNEVPIPKELMPAFQEFLQGKGIKIEPKVENPEIEEPIMKTLLVMEGISEMDLRELAHGEAFDTAEALGKVAVLKSMALRVDGKLRLAKTLQITDLELITPDSELSKGMDFQTRYNPNPGERGFTPQNSAGKVTENNKPDGYYKDSGLDTNNYNGLNTQTNKLSHPRTTQAVFEGRHSDDSVEQKAKEYNFRVGQVSAKREKDKQRKMSELVEERKSQSSDIPGYDKAQSDYENEIPGDAEWKRYNRRKREVDPDEARDREFDDNRDANYKGKK